MPPRLAIMARLIRALLATGGLALVVGALGANSAGAEEGAVVPASVGSTRIYVQGIPSPASGHLFTFKVLLDVCPPPLLEPDHAAIVERPKVGSQKGAAIVTGYVRWPEHKEQTAGESCPPEVPAWATMHVRTKRPASKLIFFDGSSSPPRRVWPPLRAAQKVSRIVERG